MTSSKTLSYIIRSSCRTDKENVNLFWVVSLILSPEYTRGKEASGNDPGLTGQQTSTILSLPPAPKFHQDALLFTSTTTTTATTSSSVSFGQPLPKKCIREYSEATDSRLLVCDTRAIKDRQSRFGYFSIPNLQILLIRWAFRIIKCARRKFENWSSR